MTLTDLALPLAAALLAIGLTAHLLVRDAIRRIVSLNVASGGVMLLLLAIATRGGGEPDPVPQALVLTGIVIMAAITGVALGLARRIERADAEEEPLGGDDDADGDET